MSIDLDQRIAFADRLADEAGAAILPYFRQRIDITDKGRVGFFDPVTEADRRAETTLSAMIREKFPQDGILGEEFGETSGANGFRWVLDPLDGTRAFIAGQPLWGTLIALEHDGRPVFGILDQPFLRERFAGNGGTAALRNASGRAPLKTRACAKLADAVINTTHPVAHFHDAEWARYARVEKACLLSRYGGDCYAYALLAMGFVDLVIEADLKPWDIAAIIPIVEGAGGILTDWNGGPAQGGGNIVAAGDPRVQAEAIALLNKA